MVVSSIWVGLTVAAAILMAAANWYIWEPRYRLSSSFEPDPVRGAGKDDIQLRSAA
jgi:hypothetical protein